ncbi:type ISP restriction/modification enzyme, partial [Anabaenopsis arnoldii]|nr:DNA methyltransferase [Anabaenopsis arnoldii]MDH6092173.1 DNA methyltransferase [Anabaenopsis arnoldii]
SGYVKERLLPRIFGFELLMAPYAICHLKLGLFLEETGYKFDGGVRLGIYLTNTLDDAIKKSETLFEEYIAEESNQAAKIKVEQQISIIIGNPPYSGISSNLTDAAIKLVEAFRYVDGVKIVEKSALQFEKNINDDYVKFFGVSQKILAKEKNKILCLITNNGYIDSLTLRGLRNNLIIHFDTINITNLHGDIKRKQSPNDQNVFDISQGVAIGFFLKDKSHKKSFSRIDLIGSRNEKYCILNRETISSSDNYQINPSSPFYFFTNQNQEIKNEYESYASIDSIFSEFSSGTETGFDKLMIGFDKLELENKIQDFLNPMCEREAIIDKWSIKGGTSQKILDIRDEFRKDFQESYFSKYLYRVFDNRFIYYKKDYLKTNSEKIMSHLSIHGNLAMILFRQQSQDGFAHVFITNCMGDKNAVSLRTREINYYFPLYVDIQANSSIFFQDQDSKRSNLKSEFVSKISENLCCSFKPETIFYYIYAIFHSPTYRTRYAEFLKIDFPRVPLTSNNELFCQLAEYGQELAALHLMKSPQLNNLITQFTENGGSQIVDSGYPKYIQGAVVINKKGDKFTGVPEQVWNFYIGGYQVCQKWLKDRKGRTLNHEDILHYQRVVVALQETIKLMQLIDQTIPSFPMV